jgi:two-component system, OmpR family, phosphate regulon sensor histidine kinase PhoR
MKQHSPNKLLFSGSLVITLITALDYFIVLKLKLSGTNLPLFPFFIIVVLGSSFLVFSFILKKYIYDRIKPIYKNIHSLKVSKEFKNNHINLGQDIIKKVNEDVAAWADQHKKEIDELKKSESYRREFLGNVSHELKTPIFNIQGYILTLLDGAHKDPKIKMEYLQKSEKNIERMINIVHDLEIISRLESGEISLNISKFDILTLSKEIFDLLETKAQKRNIRLVFHDQLDTNIPVFVFADREKIRQVLTNLIENSINYGTEGGRTKLSFYDMDENILCEVSDNGIGIESIYIPRLFERFYRVDKSRSRNQGGSGLGLAIVKHIIESHQQAINVRSAPGVGSTFSFTLKKGLL